MLLGVSRDPAMLVWLDNTTNRKVAPNENYARELMELYTLGIGQYAEADVVTAARAFTGWNLRDGEFFFNRGQHDAGPKTFLGSTGNLDGEDIIQTVVGHAATAERISRRLFAFFAYPDPAPEVLQPIAQTYLESGHDILRTVEAVFRSDAFYADASRFGHVKSPVEYVVGAVCSTGAQVRERGLVATLRDVGQDLLNPPNVAGWPGDQAWINPSTLLARFNFAARLSSARGEPNDGANVQIADLFGPIDSKRSSAGSAIVDRLAEALGALDFSTEARSGLSAYVDAPLTHPAFVQGPPTDEQTRFALEARLRGTLHLALTTPDFQTA